MDTSSSVRKPSTTKPRHKPIEINVSIYRLHVIIFIEATLGQIVQWGRDAGVERKQFTSQWLGWMRDAMAHADGTCSSYGGNGNSDIVIWLKRRPRKASEYGTLWHELHHAVDRIANHVDPASHLFADDWTSEARAYLYEFLAIAATKDLWNRKR